MTAPKTSGGMSAKLKEIESKLKLWDLDALFLQEVCLQKQQIQWLDHYWQKLGCTLWVTLGLRDGTGGVATLTRLHSAQVINSLDSHLQSRAQIISLQRGTQPVYVANIHAQHDPVLKMQLVKQIGCELAGLGGARVIIGDFNCIFRRFSLFAALIGPI